ncbi:MAG TPA: hypothetical protein VES69_12615 [Pyrinomonadaceae bacterium]|nr:hypothetical protein [Pyrinomonadaceae bacterium]
MEAAVVLSREEVRRILREVRIPVYQACLKTIYACGLRLLEKGIEIPNNVTCARGFSSTPDFVAARRLARQESLIC